MDTVHRYPESETLGALVATLFDKRKKKLIRTSLYFCISIVLAKFVRSGMEFQA